jgi:small GTP-binding protein
MDPVTLAILIGSGYLFLKKKLRNQAQLAVRDTLINPPNKVITLIGTTGAGKSTTANALLGYDAFPVGMEHGTTTSIAYKSYKGGYFLQDTPGLMDKDGAYIPMIMSALQDSELAIYVVTGQLYRQEIEFLEKLHSKQQFWNQNSNTPELRRLVLFVNKSDIKNSTMDTKARKREAQEIKQQVKNWIPSERIVLGAASPALGGRKQSPQISELNGLILNHIQTNAPS